MVLIPFAQNPTLNLYKLNDSFFWFYTINLGWSIIYNEEPHVKISNKIIFLSLKIISVSANSVDPEEMSHYVTFHLRNSK